MSALLLVLGVLAAMLIVVWIRRHGGGDGPWRS